MNPARSWRLEKVMANPSFSAADKVFLRGILDHPEDLTAWLVYADWLDEQGQSDRAEFLRLVVTRVSLPTTDPVVEGIAARVLALHQELDPGWAMMFDFPRVGNCTWRFRCPRTWDQLTATDTPDIRFCLDCRRPVFYCHTVEEAEQFAAAGECVTISSRAFPSADVPFEQPEEFLTGMLVGDDLIWDEDPAGPENSDQPPADAPPEPPAGPWWKFW